MVSYSVQTLSFIYMEFYNLWIIHGNFNRKAIRYLVESLWFARWVNLLNASLKNYHILRFGVFWDPRAMFGQAIDTLYCKIHHYILLRSQKTPESIRRVKRTRKGKSHIPEVVAEILNYCGTPPLVALR